MPRNYLHQCGHVGSACLIYVFFSSAWRVFLNKANACPRYLEAKFLFCKAMDGDAPSQEHFKSDTEEQKKKERDERWRRCGRVSRLLLFFFSGEKHAGPSTWVVMSHIPPPCVTSLCLASLMLCCSNRRITNRPHDVSS